MSRIPAATLSAALCLLAACSAEAPPERPPPEVRVVEVEPHAVANRVEVPGRVQAVRTAEVRARVDGIVQRRLYDEGSDVEEGRELFLIDRRELRASLTAAEAALARAEANQANAAQDVARYEGLVAEQAISEQEYDAAVARLRTAEADVAQMRAQVEAARLDLGHTTVVAPISGRAGRAQVTEGALVSASAATLLTTIEQLDTVYVNFSQSSADLLRVRREISAGTLSLPESRRYEVTLVLEDGSIYDHVGLIDFFDLSVDLQTGTMAVRAEFPNPDRILLPGQFVRARIEAGQLSSAVLVPQRAVQLTAQGARVYVVDDDGLVATQPIAVGSLHEGDWIVEDGLAAGDRVIVDGLQKIRPGQAVTVVGGDPAAGAALPADGPQDD